MLFAELQQTAETSIQRSDDFVGLSPACCFVIHEFSDWLEMLWRVQGSVQFSAGVGGILSCS